MATVASTEDATANGHANDGDPRSQALNAPPQSSNVQPETTSWEGLFPPELLGTVATFLDPESVGRFAVTAGPQISPVIKKAYLKRNLGYLWKNRTNPTIARAFLEANNDWRDWYDGRVLVSAEDRRIFDSIFTSYFRLVRLGQVEVVEHLIEDRGCDVNEEDYSGISLLSHALHLGARAIVQYILSVPQLDINARDSVNGKCALHYAVEDPEISTECLELLLQHGDIDVNIANERGITPLYYAVDEGNEEKLRLLLGHANMNVNNAMVSHRGMTPLHCAVMDGVSTECLALLLSHNDIDVNITDERGVTPLHYAAYNGNEEKLRLLLRHGNINVNAIDGNGITPLHAAVIHCAVSTKCLALLLSHRDVDVNVTSETGMTLLRCAVRNGNEEQLRLLLRHASINVNAIDSNGNTLLHFAVLKWAEGGDVESIVQHLIEAGADHRVENNRGITPLGVFEMWSMHEKAALIKEWSREKRGIKRKSATE